MTDRSFEIVGACKNEEQNALPKKSAFKKMFEGKPVLSVIILGGILLGCLCAKWIMTKDPTYMDLLNYNKAPDGEFLFGTDTMGRDIFSMIWYGGRISLIIGVLSTVISVFIAILLGAFSGLSPQWLDNLLMRFTEIFLSIPSLLLVVLLQAILGKANVLCLSLVIGLTSWTSIAKVVRTEVRQIRNSECNCIQMYGRRLFSYFVETSGTKFHIDHYVHGNYECAKCNHFRVYFELYGNWSSG